LETRPFARPVRLKWQGLQGWQVVVEPVDVEQVVVWLQVDVKLVLVLVLVLVVVVVVDELVQGKISLMSSNLN
jgi:hypothetical protein